ncbi:MAG: MFS transporter [Gammaproteobacteria bacterium]|nr:MFS transporter [Gammaproteobacteria bacterium]
MLTAAPEDVDDATRRAAMVMIMLSSVATAMMLSTVHVALPGIARSLHVDAVTLSWVPMAYLLASASCVLAFARLADMYGRRRLFLIGTVGVVVASLIAAGAINTPMLLAARVLQGASAAGLFATQIAIVSSVYSAAQRGAAIGATISAVYVGLSLGPVVGGQLIEWASWRAAFLPHLPLTLVALWLGLARMRFEWREERPGAFDIGGALLYACSMIALMVGLSRLPALNGALLALLGAGLLWLFFRHEHGRPDALFDVELFYTNRVFTLSCLASLVMYTATFANVMLVSLYLQYLKDVPPSRAGLIMMTQPLVMAVFSPLAGKLSDRIEPRVIASIGMGVTALGLAGFAFLRADSPLGLTVACLGVCGFGFSLFSSPNVNAIMGAVDRSAYSRASGAMSVMRVMGQLTSMALVAVLMALWLGPVTIEPSVYPQLARAIDGCFAVAAVLCTLGIALSLSRGRMHAAR